MGSAPLRCTLVCGSAVPAWHGKAANKKARDPGLLSDQHSNGPHKIGNGLTSCHHPTRLVAEGLFGWSKSRLISADLIVPCEKK